MENNQFPEEEFLEIPKELLPPDDTEDETAVEITANDLNEEWEAPTEEAVPEVVDAAAEAAEPIAEAPTADTMPVSGDTLIFTPVRAAEPDTDAGSDINIEDLFHTPQISKDISVDEHAISEHDFLSHDDMDFLYDDEFTPDMIAEEPRETVQEEIPAIPDAQYGEPAPAPVIRAPRKGRPRRKKGYGFFGIPHLLATAVWLVIVVVIGVSLGRMLWVCAADVLAFGRPDKDVSVTIDTNDTIEDIADKLHEAGLVRYPGLFKLYADLAVDEGEIASGTFVLNTLYDYHAIVNGMSAYSSFRTVIENVVIPEGYNSRQIYALLEEKGICTVAELEEYAANGEFKDFWFLEGVERGSKYCLEGFLFPDTYEFYANSTPREALGKMLLGFESRFTEELRAQLPALNERLSAKMRTNGCNEAFIAANQIDMYKLIIVASLVEEETSGSDESPKIASVIYNRYTENNEYERYLGIDATILYALGEHKDELTAEDLAIDSPYNTRTHAGLVPTPITNPGLNSIEAALDFADTSYYYYVLNPETGNHQFSRTLEEHEQWRVKFGGS